MTTISQIADGIGEHICKQAGLELEIKKVCFGIEIIMMMTVSIAVTVTLGSVFGLISETLIVTLNALLIKFIIGGSHLSGFLRCLIYSSAVILLGAWLCSIYPVWLTVNMVLLLALINLVIMIIMPLLVSYRTLKRKQEIIRKLLVILMVLFYSLLYINHSDKFYAGALIGISISVLNITPVGVNFTKWLDHITKQGGAVQ